MQTDITDVIAIHDIIVHINATYLLAVPEHLDVTQCSCPVYSARIVQCIEKCRKGAHCI